MQPKLKLLYLDDEQYRHDRMKPETIAFNVKHVYTAAEAIDALSKEHFDIVSLDHDLAAEHYDAYHSKDEVCGTGTGLEVAKYIATNTACCNWVNLHTMNSVGRQRMIYELQDVEVMLYVTAFMFPQTEWLTHAEKKLSKLQ